jgi:anti-anti-sigma regulatory factor
MAITLHIEKKGNWEQLLYAGPINEDTEVHLMPLIAQLGPNVIFNFRKVEYVNSCGVRAWINFLREAQKNRKVIFEECTPEIVSQINMIPNFRGTAHIKSVYASYACDKCDHQKWELFEEGRNLPQSSTAGVPTPKCDKCGSEMEMEELEDEFFAWVDNAA